MDFSWREWILEDPTFRLPFTLTALGVAFVLPLIGFAVYLWRMAGRIMVERIFPPAGYRMLGNRPAIRGDEAVTYARAGRAVAVFLVIMAVLAALLFWRLGVLLARAS